jgi:hypothetical protein
MRKLTLFCVLAVATLTVSILVFSGSKVRTLEKAQRRARREHEGLEANDDDNRGRRASSARRRNDRRKEDPTEDTAASGSNDRPVAERSKKSKTGARSVDKDGKAAVNARFEFLSDSKGGSRSSFRSYQKEPEKKEEQEKRDSEPLPALTVKSAASEPVASKKLSKTEARWAQIEQMKLNFPPLESILRNSSKGKDEFNIIGDVSFLLDVAILGHAKTATSFLTKWFADHPSVSVWEEEVCTLYNYQPAVLARKLYSDFPQSNVTTHRGFKCPGHFSYQYLRYFRRYFTNARIIVGVRHPIRWFESFYNFLARKGHDDLPHPNKLIGQCKNHDHKGFCTDRAQFHQHLAKFGKTNLRDPGERALLRLPRKSKNFLRTSNPIFLYDMGQIYDANATRLEQFKVDLQHFLRLKTPLPDSSNAADKTTTSRAKKKVLNICLPEYEPVRKELLAIGTRASMWIRMYFMQLPPEEVTISSPHFFADLVREWKVDPCLLASNASAAEDGGTAVELSQVLKSKPAAGASQKTREAKSSP